MKTSKLRQFRFRLASALLALGLVLTASSAMVRADFFDSDDYGGWEPITDEGTGYVDNNGGWSDTDGWGNYYDNIVENGDNSSGYVDPSTLPGYIDYNEVDNDVNDNGVWDALENDDDGIGYGNLDGDTLDNFWGDWTGDGSGGGNNGSDDACLIEWWMCVPIDNSPPDGGYVLPPDVSDEFPDMSYEEAQQLARYWVEWGSDGSGGEQQLEEATQMMWEFYNDSSNYSVATDIATNSGSHYIDQLWGEYTGAPDPRPTDDATYVEINELQTLLTSPTVVGSEAAQQFHNLFTDGQLIDADALDTMRQNMPELLNADGRFNPVALANIMLNPDFTDNSGRLNTNSIANALGGMFSNVLNADGSLNVNAAANILRTNSLPPGLNRLATTGGGGSGGGGSGGGVALPSITPHRPPGVPENIWGIVANLFNFAISVSSVIFVVLLLIGGLMYLGSAGEEAQVTKAKQLMLAAIIGLFIVLSAWTVSTFVLNKLNVPTNLGQATELVFPTKA